MRPVVPLIGGEVDLVTGQGTVAGRSFVLTDAQRALLRHLIEAEGTVTREVLEAALGLAGSSRAVDTAVHRLRARLEVDPRAPQHVISVFGEGYRFAPAPAPRNTPHVSLGLPPPRTALLGREAALRDVLSLLDDVAPVQIVGMHGVGKSSLAIAVAHASERARVVYLDLEALRGDDLWSDLARVMGRSVAGSDEENRAALLADLRMHPRTLLVLDGAQRFPDAVVALVARVADEVPSAGVLLTSTVVLDLSRARVHPLGPIELDAARALFLARAAAVGATLEADAALDELVERLDRLPLALELGAARTRTLGVQALLTRLDERFRWLVDSRAEISRHRSLHAVLALSWAELPEEAREVLVRLSVFRGPLSQEAADAVLDADARWLPSLIEASWLVEDAGRFRWLDSSRAWALEQGEPALLDDAIRRHARYQLDLLERLLGAGPLVPAVIDAIGAAFPDLWVVLERGVTVPTEATTLAERLFAWVRVVGRYAAFAKALDELLDVLPTAPRRGVLLRMRSLCLTQTDRIEEATADLRRAEEEGPPDDEVDRLLARAYLAVRGNRMEDARVAWEAALEVSPTSRVRAYAEHGLAIAARRAGSYEEAERHFHRSLAAEADVPSYRSNTRVSYSVLLHGLGRTDQACDQLALAVRELEPLRAEGTLAQTSYNLGMLEAERGRWDVGMAWVERAETLWRGLGMNLRVAKAVIGRAALFLEAGELDRADLLLEEADEMGVSDAAARWSASLTRGVFATLRGTPGDLGEARALVAEMERNDVNAGATALFRRFLDVASGLDPGAPPPDNGSVGMRWVGRVLQRYLERRPAGGSAP
ncbi:MAG: winged helix-turn-helix domain-containing protein [Myxococcales bacterium]|nr:winged helix-turn-helix domain-containing protein [Myxococcales bacterium]